VTKPTTLPTAANDRIATATAGVASASLCSLGLLTTAALAVLLAAGPSAAQVCGDVNADNNVTVTDAQRVLRASVGVPVELVCQDQCAALETRLEVLEDLLANLKIDGNNLVLTGMNFQVVSGSGETDGNVNGKGNIIIGYNEADDNDDEDSGSHNLVVGRFHSYSGYGGIVAGEDNEILGAASSVLGGEQNRAEEDGSVIVAGQDNETDGETSVILGGELNHTLTRSSGIAGGSNNVSAGIVSFIDGGNNNIVTGNGSVIGGGSNRTLGSQLAWQAGSFGPAF
jgi:hypothetical protein